MWRYEKRLQYPVNITQPNPKMAQFIMSQYGGPDGEIGASMRYLSQRYTMPFKVQKGLLTDIGTEEPIWPLCFQALSLLCIIRRMIRPFLCEIPTGLGAFAGQVRYAADPGQRCFQ
jgi:hypothetical protein